MQHITLVTGNANKAREVAAILGFPINSQSVDLPEIQSFNLEEIVRAKAWAAYERLNVPVLVEDVAFELEALNGFPGPFIKFWEKQGCHERNIQIADALGTDRAAARCGVGFADANGVLYVEGRVNGRVTAHSDGEGWGFDFYFIPDGYDKTFAQLGPSVKNNISHRALAFAQMRDVLAKRSV